MGEFGSFRAKKNKMSMEIGRAAAASFLKGHFPIQNCHSKDKKELPFSELPN
jgi:hypothetical protein